MKFFLRTPLHVFLGNTLLITVTGCKSGKKYSTPVNFYRDGDTLWVLSNSDRTWWRNVRNGAKVSLLWRGKTLDAFAQAQMDLNEIEKRLLEYIHRIPMSAKSFGIRVENSVPNAEDVARVAKDKLFIRIKL